MSLSTLNTTVSFAVTSACTACIISVNPLAGALVGGVAHPGTYWGARAVKIIDNFIGRGLGLHPESATKKALVIASFALAFLAYCHGVGFMLSAAGYALSLKEIAVLTLAPTLSSLLVRTQVASHAHHREAELSATDLPGEYDPIDLEV